MPQARSRSSGVAVVAVGLAGIGADGGGMRELWPNHGAFAAGLQRARRPTLCAMPSVPLRHGFSLVELLVTLLVLALLALLGAPTFQRVRANAASLAAAHALLGGLHLARSQALLRGLPAVLCLSADGAQCITSTRADAARGWLVFVNRGGERTPQRDPQDPLIRQVLLPAGLSLRGSRTAVTYWPVSRAGTTATFTLCTRARLAVNRAVIVSQSGRPRQRQDPAGQPPCSD
jgi:type IV fimbrial biogenesis protein FimT